MAQQFTASIYRINQYDLNTAQGIPATQGILHSFSPDTVRIRDVKGTVAANGVTMLSIISLLPDGLTVKEKDFYTPTAQATLVTAANA